MNYNSKLLIVEDEKDISDGLKLFLDNMGYRTKQAFNGLSAKAIFKEFQPDIVLLDIMLPDCTGRDLCSIFKREEPNIGIIFLSALNDKHNQLNAFSLGGDDYITKPFDLELLLSRINALNSRLTTNLYGRKKDIGNLTFDYTLNDIQYNDTYANLTTTEFKLLNFLALNLDTYHTSNELLATISESNIIDTVSSRTISVHIAKIRQKIKSIDFPTELIKTKYGLGYKYEL